MATTEDVLRLEIQLENEEKVEKLQASIDLLMQKMKAMGSAYKGTPGYQADIQRLADLKNALGSIEGAAKAAADAQKQAAKDTADAAKEAAQAVADAAKKAAKDAADAAKDAAEKQKQAAKDAADAAKKAAKDIADAMRDAARKQMQDAQDAARQQRQAADDYVANERRKARRLLEISRAVEDAQYGVAGVLNNIPSILESFNIPAQFIGGIQIAVVAAAQLYKHADDLASLFGQGKTLSEAAAMERLAKATGLSADEAERLARSQAVGKKAEEIAEPLKSPEQKKTEELVTDAIKKAGARDIVEQMLVKNEKEFDGALPGITDEKGNVLKDSNGNNRTALSDYNQAKRNFDAVDKGFGYSDLDKQNARGELLKAEEELKKARQNAGLKQLATNALPQFYAQNLPATIKKLETDPTFLQGLDWKKRRDLVKGLKAATPEAQEELLDRLAEEHSNQQEMQYQEGLRKFREGNDTARIDDDEEAAWQNLQESIKGVKEWSKDFKDKLKKELKEKTWLDTPEDKQTWVQKEAKKQHDKFEGDVSKSLAARDFLDADGNVKPNEDLTPAQQEAARRDGKVKAREAKEKALADKESREAKERAQDKMEDDPQSEGKLEFEFLQRLGSGRNASQVQAAMQARLKDQLMKADPKLSDEDAEELAGDKVRRAKKGVFEGLTQEGGKQDRVVSHQGTAAFVDAIQGGFKRESNVNKGVENRLDKLYELIAKDQQGQQELVGRFGQ